MAAFLAALPAFIAALPAMMQLMVKFMTIMEKLVLWAEKNNIEKWLEEVEGAIDALEVANTPEQKLAAARNISGIMRGLSK